MPEIICSPAGRLRAWLMGRRGAVMCFCGIILLSAPCCPGNVCQKGGSPGPIDVGARLPPFLIALLFPLGHLPPNPDRAGRTKEPTHAQPRSMFRRIAVSWGDPGFGLVGQALSRRQRRGFR